MLALIQKVKKRPIATSQIQMNYPFQSLLKVLEPSKLFCNSQEDWTKQRINKELTLKVGSFFV